MGSTGVSAGMTGSGSAIPDKQKLTNGLHSNRTSAVTSWLKDREVGTKVELTNISGVKREYTKTSATKWEYENEGTRAMTNTALANVMVNSAKSFNTVGKFYDERLKVR